MKHLLVLLIPVLLFMACGMDVDSEAFSPEPLVETVTQELGDLQDRVYDRMCLTDDDCWRGMSCDTDHFCLPPPGCDPDGYCGTVCYGICHYTLKR